MSFFSRLSQDFLKSFFKAFIQTILFWYVSITWLSRLLESGSFWEVLSFLFSVFGLWIIVYRTRKVMNIIRNR